MKSSNHEFEMYVLVDNKPIKEYSHEGSIFVEGRDKSEYTIRLRNTTSGRACFVLSVDGLSVLDGKPCADNSAGYVINGGDTLDVQCYKVDDATGAKFVFGTKDESYSAQISEGTDNVGVIGAKVFREKPKFSVEPGWAFPKINVKPFRPTKSLSADMPRGIACSTRGMASGGGWTFGNDTSFGIASNATSFNSNTIGNTEEKTSGGVIPDCATQGMDAPDEKLGTVFGDAMQWETEKITFNRASTLPDASLVVYYDSRKNLERRGIKFRKEVGPLPNPFPANPPGCPTPPGWGK